MKKEFLAIVMMVALFACKSDDDQTLTSIHLDKTELTLKVGEEYQFHVTNNPEAAPAPEYEWICTSESGNYSIGVVDDKGKFTARSEGEIVVVVTAKGSWINGQGSIKSECHVTVEPVKAEGLKLDQTELSLRVGESNTLTCSFIPENTSNKDLVWESSDVKVARVTPGEMPNTAKVSTVGVGDAIITARLMNDAKVNVECKIKVDPVRLEGLSLKETEKEVVQGESFTLTPVFTPEYATNQNIRFIR